LVRLGIILSIGAAFFDYTENLSVTAMIWSWPDLSTSLVYASSIATVAKSGLTTAALVVTILITFLAATRRFRPAV